jgi:hypothetical protein
VTKALEDRTEREDRPTRERVYAAYVLFSRGHHAEARKVMEAFKESSDEGLKYAAAFLDVLFKRVVERVGTPYPWPHGRSESAIVAGATKVLDDDLEVPYSVRGALRQMVQGALLTIDGTARRSICEAIQAAGLGSSAVNGLISVMQDEASPPWLVEHAAFITGYLQTGYPRGAGKAVAALAGLAEDVTRLAPVRHAALWGIGDVVGSLESIGMLRTGWPETVPAASDAQASPRLEQLLAGLVDECSRADQNKPEVRRAATYTAAMLARRCAVTKRKPNTVVSQVLDRLLVDDDALVRELAKWGRRIEAARLHNSYLASTEPDPSDAG